jgi:hypothetical protein
MLAKSTFGAAAIMPVVMTFYSAPRWIAVLTVLLYILINMLAAVIAALIPQESGDRLNWWREWLHHRERMTKKADGFLSSAE